LPNLVAAGDVTQSSAVLWARSTIGGNITFELFEDPGFTAPIGSPISVFAPDSLQPTSTAVGGLAPDTEYYYRATDTLMNTSAGRFVTPAELGQRRGLNFGVSGDWRGELAPYPALGNAPAKQLDFFVELGDTIYADSASPAVPVPQATTLTDFRLKNEEVYAERFGVNALGALRSSTTVFATIDDHEVTNDFAGGALISTDPRFSGDPNSLINDSALYENGLQAFQEYNPIAAEFYPDTGLDPRFDGERRLYRQRTFGSDAALTVLDARSFRDQELPAITEINNPAAIGTFLAQSFDPTRTMLGRQQVDDLKTDLLAAEQDGVTWKFVMVPEPIQNLGPAGAQDRFEGYAAERTEILSFINDADIDNVVFVAADVHGTTVNNLTYQELSGGPQIATSAWEITTGAVAFDAPFGPTVIDIATAAGLLTPVEQAIYDGLPVAPDRDNIPNDKDDYVETLTNQLLAAIGYDPLGLDVNLTVADGLIDAILLQGDYFATHTFGWTEFLIDPVTQALTVTTYGIAPYTAAELDNSQMRDDILAREPFIVSHFVVNPQFDVPLPGTIALLFVGLTGIAYQRRGRRR
jgi:phosphodiesterase/alkaline phosphatase D-like protein